jgi:hypothetical protein
LGSSGSVIVGFVVEPAANVNIDATPGALPSNNAWRLAIE